MSERVQVRPDEYRSLWQQVPGWTVSLLLHAVLFFVFLTAMRGCEGRAAGEAGEEDFRDFGIYVEEPAETEKVEPEVNDAATQNQQVVDANPIDDTPPADVNLPTVDMPAIGAGPPVLPPSVGDEPKVIVKSGGAPLLPGALGLGPGETSFMDIRDSGKRFVYIIDCSGSMMGNRIRFAQAQLTSSLHLLEPSQEFQVLFYNTSVVSLSLKGGDRDQMYRASEVNTKAAVRAIRGVRPNQGTRHVPALERALRMRPDVIFFLTDGHDRPPSVGDIERLKKLNAGKSRLHCIEFGQGALLSPVTWLRTLARNNGGRYKYVDVTRIPDRP